MSYIGNSITQQSFTGGVDQFNGNASNTTFGLSRQINTVYDIDVYVENVWQRPTTGYTVSANTITFTSAPSAGSNNVVVVYRNFSATSVIPQQGSVTTTSFAANAIPATLGYTPANKAGDTFTGAVTITGTGTIGSGSNNYFTINGSVSAGQPAYISAAGADANVGIDINTKANGDLRLNTNSAVRMLVSGANGNIGINKSSPVAPFHVYGTGTSGQTNAAIIIENGSSGTLGIDITGSAGSSYARMRYGGGPGTGTNSMTGDLALIGLEGSSIGFQQIKFAPTQVASSDSNTLDDYEEGTFTPNLVNNGGTSTWAVKIGRYAKIGSVVFFWCYIDSGNAGSGGALLLTGLPFVGNGSGSTMSTVGTIITNLGSSSSSWYPAFQNSNTNTAVIWSGGSQVINPTIGYSVIQGCYNTF